MLRHLPRRASIALATAVVSVALAPVASANITPSLVLTPSTSNAGASGQTLGMHFTFAPTSGDSPKDLTVGLPPGLLDDATIDGGACLASVTPIAPTPPATTSPCRVASGTAIAGGISVPASLDLVKGPSATDLGGLALLVGGNPVSTGAIVVRPASDPAGVGLNLLFTGLPALGVSDINVSLTGIRMPASCPSSQAKVTVAADSQASTTVRTAAAALPVTNCSALAFAPRLAARAVEDTADAGVQITTAITQGATESPNRSVALTVPASTFSTNLAGAAALLGSTTPVGAALATSPLLPGTLTGAVYLVSKPAIGLEIRFPAPFPLVIDGAISLGNNSVTFTNLPDVPLTALGVTISGGPHALFTTTCASPSANLTGAFTGQNGKTAGASAAVAVVGCSTTAPPPKAGSPRLGSASLTGVAAGRAHLSLRLIAGDNGAPKLTGATVGAPAGLSFVKATLARGVSVAGARLESVSLSGAKLVIKLKSAVSSFTVKVAPAATKVSPTLRRRVERHRVRTLVSVTVTQADGTSRALVKTVRVR